MKSFIAAALVCLLVLGSAPASAQTRTRRSTAPQRRRAPATSPADAARLNSARLQLAELNKDLTRFLYLYGRLSKDLELTGAQKGSADVASRTKAGLVENVRAMRDRLDKLESQFRFTSGLERQYRTLEGVSRRAEEAERRVSANQFDQAGRILLDISTQLTDTLIEM